MIKEEKVLENVIFKQAEVFLLDAGEFFPFGSYIDLNGVIKPVGVYAENENPPAEELIVILKNYLNEGLESDKILIGAIGLDVNVKNDGRKYDALQVLFLEKGFENSKYFIYRIGKASVEFEEIEI
jgi:hypothetical protein